MQAITIQISPMQWAHLQDIADVPQISNQDHQVLDEIRGVLLKRGAIGRFGIHLIHSHFEIAADEGVAEFMDVQERTLHCKVEKRQTEILVSQSRIETIRSFDGDGATPVYDRLQQRPHKSKPASARHR